MPSNRRNNRRSGRRTGRTTRKKKTYRKKKYPNAVTGLGFGADNRNQKAFAKLKYNQTVQISPTSTHTRIHNFSLNSIYDPDYTGVGHQPFLHDELAAHWTKYDVYACKVDVRFETTSTNQPIVWLKGSDAVNTSTSYYRQYIAESGMADTSVLMPQYVSGATKPVRHLSYYYKMSKLADRDTVGQGTPFGSGPSNGVFVAVGTSYDDVSSDTVSAHVTLTYYCTVQEPKVPGQS